MNEIIHTSHAILLSEDYKTTLLEKNERFWWKLTLFWWKLEDWEDALDWLKREIYEEAWLVLFTQEIHLLNKDDKLVLWSTTFIWCIYYVLLHKKQIEKVLWYSDRNVEIETSIESLWKIDFAFDKVREQINWCLDILNNNKLNK